MKNRRNLDLPPARLGHPIAAWALFALSACSRSELAPDYYYEDAGVRILPGDTTEVIPSAGAAGADSGAAGASNMPPVETCDVAGAGVCARRAVGEHCVGDTWVRCAETSAGCPYEATLVPSSPICTGVEICGNGIDDNLDGKLDCEDSACAGPACPEVCDDRSDNDGDGAADCDDADCSGVGSCPACAPAPVLTASSVQGDTRMLDDTRSGSCGGATAPEAAYTWRAPSPGCYTFGATSADFDTVLYATTPCPDEREIACNDDLAPNDTSSRVSLTLAQDEAVVLHVDGYSGGAGPFVFTVEPCHEQCSGGGDEDGDGLVDCADPDCVESCRPASETQCEDGADEDGDGLTDCADPDCAADAACLPSTELNCANGLDDDQDGQIDCDDEDCSSLDECQSFEVCDNALDDDMNGLTDCADTDCAMDLACASCAQIDVDLASVMGTPVFQGSTTGQGDSLTPMCVGDSASPEVVHQWQAEASGCYQFDTLGSSFDTVLQVYSACPDFAELACNDDAPDGGTASLVKRVVASGEIVALVVDGFGVDSGSYELNITPCIEECGNYNDDDLDGLIDCLDPDCDGSDLCAVEVCGNGLDDDGNGSIDCQDMVCAANEECQEICDNGIDDNRDGLSDCAAPECAMFAGCAMCVETVQLPSVDVVAVTGSTVGGVDHMQATCGGGAMSADIVYSWIAPTSGCFRIDTAGSEMDTVLHVHTPCPSYAQTHCDDDTVGRTSRVEIDDVVAGAEYIIVLDGFGAGEEGQFSLAIAPCP